MNLMQPRDDMFDNQLPLKLEYIESNLTMAPDPHISVSWSVGPAYDFSLIPAQMQPMGLESSWSDKHKFIMAPLAFGGHWVCYV